MHGNTADTVPDDLRALTSLRFAAAVMIFLYHLREYAPSHHLYAIAVAMNQGVSFFFVLSGFVLTHVYSRRQVSFSAFILSRFARIFPVHVAAILLLVLALPLADARGQNLSAPMAAVSFAAKLLMVESWAPLRGMLSSWNSVSWSLSDEAFFYLAFPFLLARLERHCALMLALAGVGAFAVYALGVALHLPVFEGDRMTPTLYSLGSFNPVARGFEFVLGMAAYLVWRRCLASVPLSLRTGTAMEAAAFGLLGLWLWLAVPAIAERSSGAFFVWFRASGSAWAFTILIAALAAGRGMIGRALSLRPFVLLGEISFAFYLVHVIVMRAFQSHFGEAASGLAILATSLYFAALLHFAVEKPLRAKILARCGSRGARSGEEAIVPRTRPHPALRAIFPVEAKEGLR